MWYIYREIFEDAYGKDKKYWKARVHFHYIGKYRGAENSIYNSKFSIPKEITITFHSGSNFDYHSIKT